MARDFPKKLDILPFFCYNGLILPERSPAMPSPSILVTILRVLFFIAAPACLALAGLLFWVQFTFSRRPKSTAKTAGILREATHKQNVTLHGTRGRSMFVKHLTKARYVYTVDGVEYSIRGEYFGTKRQTPKFVPVVYIKRFPRFAYIDEIAGGFGDILYGLWGLVFLAVGLSLCVGIGDFLIKMIG